MDEAGWHAVRPNLSAVAEAGEWWRLVTGPITQPEFSDDDRAYLADAARLLAWGDRSEEHTSELQSLMRTSYDVFCFKKPILPTKRAKHLHSLHQHSSH